MTHVLFILAHFADGHDEIQVLCRGTRAECEAAPRLEIISLAPGMTGAETLIDTSENFDRQVTPIDQKGGR
jgi:hypothetical protein